MTILEITLKLSQVIDRVVKMTKMNREEARILRFRMIQSFHDNLKEIVEDESKKGELDESAYTLCLENAFHKCESEIKRVLSTGGLTL